jgi:hypothetical protein
VLIVEGLNVLQPPRSRNGRSGLAVSDFFDFSVYVDASLANIREWYVARFLRLRETAFADPDSYFHRYAALSDAEAARDRARDLVADQRAEPAIENVQPTRSGPRWSSPRAPTTRSAGSVCGRSEVGRAALTSPLPIHLLRPFGAPRAGFLPNACGRPSSVGQ